jgi:hypothetical protein
LLRVEPYDEATPNVRSHRADEMKDPTRRAAPKGPGGPRSQA